MLKLEISQKDISGKILVKDSQIVINNGEIIGFIGRNGTGKSTLLKIMAGLDTDYDGKLHCPKNQLVMSTLQEHHNISSDTLNFVFDKLPRYRELQTILETYPDKMGDNLTLIDVYSQALSDFTDYNYYNVENEIYHLFDKYQIDIELLERSFQTLSGGQKRLIELISIQLAKPDIVLLDEPTNHMDYVAKDTFLDWLKNYQGSAVIVSHDRDVLNNVNRVIELKDLSIHNYSGNYANYLAQNTIKTTNSISEYQTNQKRIANLKEQIEFAKARSAKGGPRWVTLRMRYERELEGLLANNEKPSFWIDRESTANLKNNLADNYHKYKAKNIKLSAKQSTTGNAVLLTVSNLKLGYQNPLFANLTFQLGNNSKLHVIGRNGAGKTTLVNAIVQSSNGVVSSTVQEGKINCHQNLRLSIYNQEISDQYLHLTLAEAITKIFTDKNLRITDTEVKRQMGNYLFNVETDYNLLVSSLSGGQKARLQLINMFAGEPNLLILDEPTNHLDLPSIEELEQALANYSGAIIYITHDSYFAKNVGGDVIKV